MATLNISNKILNWYDNNKRDLPWRHPKSKEQSHYYTLISEFMLQQTQVKTVIPYFKKFVYEIPNINSLSKVDDRKLLKLWEGLGYYSRAKNLKRTAKLILKRKKKHLLPDTLKDLKELPGIGDYTSKAILALEYNRKVIPLDGNIERLIKRIFYLRKINEIKKENLMLKTHLLGYSSRQRDYVQALMEFGSLICKPSDPLCNNCPINNKCASFKLKDFKILKKIKSNKVKYFKADIYCGKEKTFLIKNNKFNFLKNLLIFPMNEIKAIEYNSSKSKKFQIKISNMNMKILINKNNKIPNKKGTIVNYNKIDNAIIPSFTKKIFDVALSQ